MMNYKRSSHRFWLRTSRIGFLIGVLLLSFWILNIPGAAGNASHQYYFPYFVQGGQVCGQEYLVNGNFEQDDYGWQLYSNAWGWKIHDLIGSKDEGFSPFNGDYAAKLGGYEGITDYIEQTVVIPENGKLTYWWKMHTSERQPYIYDNLRVDFYEIDHSWFTLLEFHNTLEINGVWQQDVVDLTEYGGRTFILRFTGFNNNYEGTGFYLDEVYLCSWIE